MATLAELHTLRHESDLLNKVAAACAIKAKSIMDETPPVDAARLLWAEECIADADVKARSLFWYVLAANAGATVGNIQAASDAAIQSNVDDAIDVLRPAS